MSDKNKSDFDRISDICFVCNTIIILILQALFACVIHLFMNDWGFSIILAVLMFFPCAFIEERCISSYVNKAVELIYGKIVHRKR